MKGTITLEWNHALIWVWDLNFNTELEIITKLVQDVIEM